MNNNASSDLRNHAIMATIKSRITGFLCAGVVLLFVSGWVTRAGAQGFLPNQMIVSTVPLNGDVNPYGVAFVPEGFQHGLGPLRPGDILVSNFNNKMNLQGTGTTIVRVSKSGTVSPFFAGPPHHRGSSGLGLSTALAVLRAGFVIVGNVPSTDGTSATVGSGGLLVIDSAGNQVSTITDPKIDGP
jgi:hypothetical protein